MRKMQKMLAFLLAVVLCLGALAPMATATELKVSDYATFLKELKVLEGYAEAYAQTNTANDANELLLNFIRTGVNKYTTDSWTTLAGAEITGFTAYVAQQDEANGTTASSLRNLAEFTTPNGQTVEFEHMFGAMNIAYLNSRSADLGSWAGDLCDLVSYTKGNVSGDVETMVSQIRENYFGVDEAGVSGFGMLDVYGDLDSYYLMNQIKAGTALSSAMESYYTASLTDSDRAAYFLNNRFGGLETKEDVRNIIYKTYTSDVAIKVLEADNGITSADADLRKACCYCFADYLFELAGDRLEGGSTEEEEEKKFYTVFSSTDSTLAPGIEQNVSYALTGDDKQLVYYYMTIDVSREDVQIHANYKDHDPSNGWGMARVPDQIAAAQAYHSDPDSENYIENFNVIGGVNGDFYNMSTGKPTGVLVMDGVTYQGNVNSRCFFAILNDGTAVIGTPSEWATYEKDVKEALGGSAVILRDGEILASAGGDRAPRTAAGITADGKVVLMVLDGRQDPFSAGTTLAETARIMLDAGCVEAINLDGGGSSTFASKPEGSDTVKVISSPSDGYVRSVSSSLLVASTAWVSNEFDHAIVSTDYDYLTVNTRLALTAIGVSITGNSAVIPENAVWQLSDETIGTIENDVFTACDNGDVEVQLVVDGTVVGSKTLHVVVPNGLTLKKDNLSAVYGVPVEIPVILLYDGNEVAFNDDDIFAGTLENSEGAGVFEGRYFTADKDAGFKTAYCAVVLLSNDEIGRFFTVNLYDEDEAFFDFDNATAGNRTLAWLREVDNATTEDNLLYQSIDVSQPMNISYTFGIDMSQIEIPAKLADLTDMLPGSDVEGASAWTFLLQLAERVSALTEVSVKAQFDKDLDIDISELTIVNEYFELRDVSVDEETNEMTLTVGWIKQTQAINPTAANPICILSGIKATPKADAQWDEGDQLVILNSGNVSYNIYLRATALYNFACDEANQAEYSLYPFVNPNLESEKGASFGSAYADFEDSFVLSNKVREGWTEIDGNRYYFVENAPLTGNHKLPSYDNSEVEYLYSFDENGVCTGTLTGLIELDGDLYYAILGEIKTGWRPIEGNYYYFDMNTGAAVNGEQTINGYTYTFTDYILTKGQIVQVGSYYRYYWAGSHVIGKWIEVDGNTYYATYPKGYFATGMVYARNPEETASYRYVFDTNGVFRKDVNGLYDYSGQTYYVEDGRVIDEPGLVYFEGNYYYFCSTGAAVKGRTYWISKTNGLLPAGPYYFDAEGKMTNPPVVEPEDPEKPDDGEEEPIKDGIVEVNGVLYYYKDGVLKFGAGLILLDGDYYYVRSNGALAIGRYWVTVHNDLLPQGMYTFGADGKMINPPVEEEPTETTPPSETEEPSESEEPSEEPQPVKNGIYEENGVLYYYENGVRAYGAGLIKLDGDYYYVRSNGALAIGRYWVTVHNGLLPQGMYTFGADGKMVNPPVEEEPEEPTETTPPSETEEPSESEEPSEEPEPVKNGIYRENGILYYYENGVRAYGAGLILLDGDYYYVRSNAQLAIGKYWVTVNNDLLPQGMYTFGEDGKMIR